MSSHPAREMNDKARKPRTAALRAQQTFVTNGAGYQASSDDDEEVGCAGAPQIFSGSVM